MTRTMTKTGAGQWATLIALVLLVQFLSACVAVQSFPVSARAGDTVMLAVGSPDGMNKGNTSATFTPGGGGSAVPLPIRSIFKLYPDKTSAAWLDSGALGVENDTGHGPWTTIVALDLPTTLPTGPGAVQITTGAVYPPPPARNINDTTLTLEILPGSGSPAPFTYELAANLPVAGDLTQLEPGRRLVVKPVFTGTGTTTYGAIEVRINIPFLDQIGADNVRVVIDDKIELTSSSRRIQYTWSVQGTDLVVFFISPTGGLDYSQAHFSIISANIMSLIDAALLDVNTLSPVATYFDVNGNAVGATHVFTINEET
ncbi:MAG TPA: hypothetical protein ENK12_07355 [Gammaproteobacteria bacterium]|nr:hypothetical protein [Gammaproteobacteria bacterium]